MARIFAPYPLLRTEPNMRQELINTLQGLYPEIPKKQQAVLRKLRRPLSDNICPCVSPLTKEPDKDRFCPICLTGDTLVWTPNGLKEIQDILVGDRVIGGDSDYYNIIDKQKFYSQELISVKSRLRGDPIEMTHDHKMMVIKREDYKNKRFIISEVMASELQEKDLLIMPKPVVFDRLSSVAVDWSQYKKPKGTDPITVLPDCLVLTDDFLWTIGLWIAKGSIGGDREIIFTLHIDEVDLANRVEASFKAISSDITITHTEKPEVNTRIISVFNAALARWFKDQCGSGCDQKHMPHFYRVLSPAQQMQVVWGLWEGDGCTIHNDSDRGTDRMSIGITARKAIHEAQITLWQNGYIASLSIYQRKNRKRVYTLEWINEPYRATREFYEFDSYWATCITEIKHKTLPSAIPVYDLTIEDNHQFIANNTLSHNCHGEGWLWDEIFMDVYKIVIKSDVGNALIDSLQSPGIISPPLVVFYTKYDNDITKEDKVVELVLDTEGDPVQPYRRRALYHIGVPIDFRSDNGRLEYWKLNCVEDKRKFLNGVE